MGDSCDALLLKLEYFRRSEKQLLDRRIKESESIFIPTDNDPLHIIVEIYRFTVGKGPFSKAEQHWRTRPARRCGRGCLFHTLQTRPVSTSCTEPACPT